jgi:N-acetylmuramoyl-L-alanine amidase
MKSWTDLEPDRYRLLTKNYTPGRGGRKIRYVVIHHNAGMLSIDQIWQVWQTREASAYYQVTIDGQIGQLVNDSDTAWHAANLTRNQESIGIEHANSGGASADWPIAEKTREEGAHLVAAICRYYGLGRPAWGVNVRPHSETGQTSCPYRLGPNGEYGKAYIARAQYWYDQMGSATPTPAPPKETPVTDDQTALLRQIRDNTADCRAMLMALSAQDMGDPSITGPYGGWPQTGYRTRTDLLAAIGAKLGVPGTTDTKEK